MSRKFFEDYKYEYIDHIFIFIDTLLNQIDYYINKEELSEENIDLLNNSKQLIINIKEKYIDAQTTRSRISDEKYNYISDFYNKHQRKISEEESYELQKKAINSSETFKNLKTDFEKIFDIENLIHDKITIPVWKKSVTDIDTKVEPGDKFSYIVHSGNGIISLPGSVDYNGTQKISDAYLSTSLLTDKQMSMYRSNVGLILEPNESILCTTATDSLTDISEIQNFQTIMDLKNGFYINSGLRVSALYSNFPITTKIQSPNHLTEETITIQKKRNSFFSNTPSSVNEVLLDTSKAKVKGVFFKTNGCEINLNDFKNALEMEKIYNVPIKIVNESIYKEKAGINPYGKEDLERYEKDFEFWENPENLEKLTNNTEEFIYILKRYYNDVVVEQQYKPEIKKEIEELFSKIINDLQIHSKNNIIISPDETLETALKSNVTIEDTTKARNIEKSELKMDEVNKGETKDD